jgi:HAMP domain-containing protein
MKSIKNRLNISMALLILFFLAQAGAVTWFVAEQREQVSEKVNQNTLASSELAELSTLAQQVRRYEKEYFVYVGNEEKRNGYIKEYSDTSARITKLIETMVANKNGAFNKLEVQEINRWRDANTFYASEMNRIFETVRKMQVDVTLQAQTQAQLAASITAVTPPSPPANAAVATPGIISARLPTPVEANDMIKAGKDRFSAELIKGVATQSKSKTQATLGLGEITTQNYNRLLMVVLATVLLGVALAVFLMLTVPRAVTRPIERLSVIADEISRGNLDRPFPKERIAEFEPLARSLEKMRIGLSVLTRKMKARATADML